MANTLSVFKKFQDKGLATELADLLNENGIEALLIDNSPDFDITFSGNTLRNEYEVKIRESDFEQAEALLKSEAKKWVEQIDRNYYLFDFSTEELYDILANFDQWSEFDFELAKKILEDRGEKISINLVNSLRKQRIDILIKPEDAQNPWIFGGYFFAILGGVVGVFIGWYLWTFRKTLPDGKQVYMYAEADRTHGKRIFIVGICCTVLWLLLKMVLS